MDTEDVENETWLRLCCGSSSIRIATRPNIVFKWDSISFELLLDSLNENCGIWGADLPGYGPIDTDVWEGEWPLVESFWRWNDPLSQERLRKEGGFGSDTSFQMLIPANASLKTLRRIRDSSSEFGPLKNYDWEKELSSVVDWVEELRWACIPLVWAEMGLAMFVTGSIYGEVEKRVMNALRRSGHARATIVSIDGCVQWSRL